MKNKIWIVSGPYYTKDTVYPPAQIAEHLSKSYSVSVLCSQPTFSAGGKRSPCQEISNGVTVYRCKGSNFNNDILVFKFINALTISLSIFFSALLKIKRNEQVIVVTNPPSLIFTIGLACWLRGASCLLLIYDVYPDILVAAGLLNTEAPLNRALEWATKKLYRHVAGIIVIGRDMEQLISCKIHGFHTRVDLIPNWADIEHVKPLARNKNSLLTRLGLIDKFVIQYSGNMGPMHGIENLFQSTKELAPDSIYHFLFIGSGAKKEWLINQVQHEGLCNVNILAKQPYGKLADTLNASDVAIISLSPGMLGTCVPSRLYNVMAAGKPIIAVADKDSELALVVNEEKIGWVVPPGNVKRIVAAIREAKSDPFLLKEMGKRARHAAERKYSFDNIMNSYLSLMHELDNSRSTNCLGA